MDENKEFEVESVEEVTEPCCKEAEQCCCEENSCCCENTTEQQNCQEAPCCESETLEVEEVEETEENVAEEIKTAIEDVKEGVSKSVKELMDRLKNVEVDKEALKGHLDSFKTSVNDTIAKANEKVNSLKEDPKANEYWQKAKDTYTSASEAVVKSATDVYGKAMENETVKSAVEKVSEKAKEVSEVASEKYQQFVHDPNVRKNVVGVVNKVSGLFGNVVSSVKSAFVKQEVTEEETEVEEEKVEEE